MEGIVTLQSGFPFTVRCGCDNSRTGTGSDTPDVIGVATLAGEDLEPLGSPNISIQPLLFPTLLGPRRAGCQYAPRTQLLQHRSGNRKEIQNALLGAPHSTIPRRVFQSLEPAQLLRSERQSCGANYIRQNPVHGFSARVIEFALRYAF